MTNGVRRNKNWTSVFFGFLVFLLPLSGLPSWIKTPALVFCGLIIVLIALSSRHQ